MVPKRVKQLLANICIIGNISVNSTVIIASVIECATLLRMQFPEVPTLAFKVGIIMVYLIMTALIIERERIKPYSFIASIIITLISTIKNS